MVKRKRHFSQTEASLVSDQPKAHSESSKSLMPRTWYIHHHGAMLQTMLDRIYGRSFLLPAWNFKCLVVLCCSCCAHAPHCRDGHQGHKKTGCSEDGCFACRAKDQETEGCRLYAKMIEDVCCRVPR